MTAHLKKLSIVIPLLNEAGCLEELYKSLLAHTQTLPYDLEMLFIDDGSADESFDILQRLQSKDSRVRFFKFSRNFGHQMALLCGIENAQGDAVITMDADLQHPPAMIPSLTAKWEEGFRVVNTRRLSSAVEKGFKKMTAAGFYKIFSAMTGLKIEGNLADFRLMDRKVIDQLKKLSESCFFLRGMISWIGYKQTTLDYSPATRFAGETKYSLRKMIAFAAEGLTSFTILPLRLATILGLAIICADLLYLIYALVMFFVFNTTQKGWTSVIFILSVYSAIQILLIGLMGEYIAKIHLETKKRPRYIVEESF